MIGGTQLAKNFIRLILLIIFILHSWEMVHKYIAKKTMTVEEKLEVNEVSMAHITVCSEEPYSRSGYFYNKTAFDENAFTFEDLFHEGAEKILQDQGLTITETLSQVRGRCFTLSTKKRYTSGNALLIPLKKDGNPVLTIIHTVGETFWMNADFWPDEPGMETFEEPTHCTVVEKNELALQVDKESKNEVSCEYWSNTEFFECAKNVLKSEIKKMEFKCHTVWWKDLFPPESPECTENELAEVVRFSKWIEDTSGIMLQLTSRGYKLGCPTPCFSTRFKVECRENLRAFNYHALSLAQDEDDLESGVQVTFSMKMNVETEEQILIYDFSAIVAGLGGSLGLFLGFSCLQAFDPVIDKAKLAFKNQNH